MAERSSRAEVRNPILALPSIEQFDTVPMSARAALLAVLTDMERDSRARAELCWRKHKGPMASYWKGKAVDIRHIRLAIRKRPCPQECSNV